MSWFAELNPQFDWYNHSVQLDLDAEKHSFNAACTADSCSDIDICTADQFSQLLSKPKSRATAFAVRISHVEAPNSCSLMHVETVHRSLSSWLSS